MNLASAPIAGTREAGASAGAQPGLLPVRSVPLIVAGDGASGFETARALKASKAPPAALTREKTKGIPS